MMKQRLNVVLNLALFAMLGLLTGCTGLWVAGGAAAVGGTGAYVYTRGTYRAVLDAPLFYADQALRTVCKRANLIELERECNGFRSNYRYQDMHENKVKFQLRTINPETTRIYIRVGRCGDKEASQQLLQAIDRELQTMPRA
jgi:hypothetical protein